MCYRCGVCRVVVGPREPRRLHRIYRTIEQQVWAPVGSTRKLKTVQRKEIAREVAVCSKCETRLGWVPLAALLQTEAPAPVRKRDVEPAPAVVPAPARKGLPISGRRASLSGLGDMLKR